MLYSILGYRYSVGAANDSHHPMIHPNIHNPPTSTRNMSTSTDPILDAVAAINAQEPKEQPMYRAAADTFSVNKDTLRRRYKG
jgi:hypothetical protein